MNSSEGIKRIEYRGDYVRTSRTGGVAGRTSVYNKKICKGARVGFQKGRFQFIGRYGKGLIKINQSKKSFSPSTSSSFGSYNYFKPQYLSFKMRRYHVQGQTA